MKATRMNPIGGQKPHVTVRASALDREEFKGLPAITDTEGPEASATPWRERILRSLKARLASHGWEMCASSTAVEMESFDDLIPAADTIFAICNPLTKERCPVAVHFSVGSDVFRYACTLRRRDGQLPREHGCIDIATGELNVVSTRGDWGCAAPTQPLPPASQDRRVQTVRQRSATRTARTASSPQAKQSASSRAAREHDRSRGGAPDR